VLGRTEVVDLLKRSRAGLVTLHDLPVYQVSLPIKMFEYMAAGLPIIASDFPFWRELLNDYDCAIFVNPHVPQESAGAIDWILSNPDQAYAMGARGRYGVLSRYNWAPEAEKLVAFYTDRFAIPRKGPLQ
jgi:glycosyltransferase involved in cell wall biosynthesis